MDLNYKAVSELARMIEFPSELIQLILKSKSKRVGSLQGFFTVRGSYEDEYKRLTVAPSKELKDLQQRILYQIFYRFEFPEYVQAFCPEKSIRTNAEMHRDSQSDIPSGF